jgi:segregation and condensation protein A
MSYKVKIDAFEGPFDLLVYLIENAEMNIYDIRISEITNQYVNYLALMKDYNIEIASEFMVLAATLIELKSKMLLPRPRLDDELGLLEDPRKELVQKLLEYKRFKSAAENLAEQEEQSLKIFTKPQEDLSIYNKEPDAYIDLDLSQFVRAFNLFIQKKKSIEDIHKRYERVEREQVSVEDKIRQIKGLFQHKSKLSFTDLFDDYTNKYEIVVTFISILELIRLKVISVRQHVNFGEIVLTMKTKNTEKGDLVQ